jgi:hypothetical protein
MFRRSFREIRFNIPIGHELCAQITPGFPLPVRCKGPTNEIVLLQTSSLVATVDAHPFLLDTLPGNSMLPDKIGSGVWLTKNRAVADKASKRQPDTHHPLTAQHWSL